jgi:hypothetical protein
MNPQSETTKIFLLWGSLAWNILWTGLVLLAGMLCSFVIQRNGIFIIVPFAVSGWIGSLFPLIWMGIFYRKARIPIWHYLPIILLVPILLWQGSVALYMIEWWLIAPNAETF